MSIVEDLKAEAGKLLAEAEAIEHHVVDAVEGDVVKPVEQEAAKVEAEPAKVEAEVKEEVEAAVTDVKQEVAAVETEVKKADTFTDEIGRRFPSHRRSSSTVVIHGQEYASDGMTQEWKPRN